MGLPEQRLDFHGLCGAGSLISESHNTGPEKVPCFLMSPLLVTGKEGIKNRQSAKQITDLVGEAGLEPARPQ